jgi:hypothetical protein
MKGERRHAAQRVANGPAIGKEEEHPYASLSAQLPAGGASSVTDLGAIEPIRTQAEQLAHFVVRATYDDLCLSNDEGARGRSGGSARGNPRIEQLQL